MFSDPEAFCSLLVESAAFGRFRDQLKLFIESEAPLEIATLLDDHGITDDDDGRSIHSLESSTTLFSISSVSTAVEKSATVELQRIFQEDVELIGLYRCALKDTSMGPARLQRNIVRLLQFFAKDLRREAGANLEKEASRFVHSKAHYVAHCIIEDFNDTQPPVSGKRRENEEDSRKQDEDQYEVDEKQPKAKETLLGADDPDMDELAPIDEDYFEDLATLRTFLVQSSAFQMFRARLTKFVLPKGLRQQNVDFAVNDRRTDTSRSRSWRSLNSLSRISKAVVVAAGCLESPLQPGSIRLRWQCASFPAA
jgi:hypothetical protein